MDTRDFSVDTIEEIYDIIEELKNQGTFLDSMGDFWIRGEPDAVMLCTYAANGEMEEYYRKYADSMNLTKEKFGKIVENVRAVDKKYQEKFTDAKEEMQDFQEKLKNLAQEISMRTISLSEGQYRRAVEVLEGEDNQKKRQLETLIGVTRGSSGSSRMEEKIREILKYSVGNGNLEDELDVESTESGISQKRKMITKVEELKQQFKKGKITQDELISQICELYHVEDYGSKINYSLAVKKYQPEKKAAIVSDIFSTVLYIIGEDGIDAEKIEEIRQSVSAKSYIDDETWDMVEKAFRGVVVGVNAAVAADYYGNVGKVESGSKSIDNAIPNVESATINPKKLTEYALNPNHPVGGNKAKVFESALGYNQSNADDLMRQIYEKLPSSEAVVGKLDQYGQRYTVDIPIMGPNGNTVNVRTGWITKTGSDIPELTTIYVKD